MAARDRWWPRPSRDRARRGTRAKSTVVCEGDAHAAIVRSARARGRSRGETPTIEVTAVDEGAGAGRVGGGDVDDEAAEMKDTALIVVNGDVVMDVDVDDVGARTLCGGDGDVCYEETCVG